MTAVGYPDITEISQNRKYRIEARSPDNGTINQRDGSPADTTTFGYTYGSEQRGFRYQLIDQQNSTVLWERWQEVREDSPRELCVSNKGWAVIRLHGYASAALIVVSREGHEAVPVAIGRHHNQPTSKARTFITDEHVSDTSAGLSWTRGAVRYFFGWDNRPYFCYVTGWGRRIVLDLENGRVVNESKPDPDLARACIATEHRMVNAYLSQVAEEYEDYDGNELFGSKETRQPFWERWPYLAGHIGLTIRNAYEDALPYLRKLEQRSLQQGYTRCNALPNRHDVFIYWVRPLLSLAMRHLGQTPKGYACCGFFRDDYSNKILLHIPDCVRYRDGKIESVRARMSSRQVLDLLGAPDYLRSYSDSRGGSYVRGEHWHYYTGTAGNLSELRITWKAGSDGSKMARLEIHRMHREDVHRRIYQAMQM
ncbi:hypothetical protein OT109_04635 [Phycisphaeraceae bacterium D3-23]